MSRPPSLGFCSFCVPKSFKHTSLYERIAQRVYTTYAKRVKIFTRLKVNEYSPLTEALREATGQAELVELWTLKKVDRKKGLSVWAKP